jgi:DNA primase
MIQAIKPKTTDQVKRAKETSITSISKQQLYRVHTSGVAYMCLCPFHDDHHPSLALYPETNTFHCFACKESGDVIKLYMKLYNCDFKTAVRELVK